MIKVIFEANGDGPFFFEDLTPQKEIELFLAGFLAKYIKRENALKRMLLRQATETEIKEEEYEFLENSPHDVHFFLGEDLEECYIFEAFYVSKDSPEKECRWSYAVVIKKEDDPIEIKVEKYLTHENPLVREMARKLKR